MSEFNPAGKKIAYLLGGRFPTNKAYGITCRETINELVLRGHQAKIFCYEYRYSDSDFEKLMPYIHPFRSNKITTFLRKFGESGKTVFHKLAWKSSLLLDLRINFDSLNQYSPEIIWVRNPEIANLISKNFPKAKIVVEIHYSGPDKYYKNLVNAAQEIVFAPISKSLENYIGLQGKNLNVISSPMSINKSILSNKSDVATFVQELRERENRTINIGYVGKFAPGGYSKGVEDLIYLAGLIQQMKLNMRVILVGGEDTHVDELKKLCTGLGISDRYISIMGHVSHTEAVTTMRMLDVLVLTLPRDSNYNGSPLKTIEYCAVGKIVIAAHSDLYAQIFEEKFEPFWYTPYDENSLLNAIQEALDSQFLEIRIDAGVRMASSFTWEKRTETIMNAFDR
jgi:glycosyltransferase involved in cell wall biosynthesis